MMYYSGKPKYRMSSSKRCRSKTQTYWTTSGRARSKDISVVEDCNDWKSSGALFLHFPDVNTGLF